MKIKEYLEKNGIRQSWMAAQLGVSVRFFNSIVNDQRQLPKKYWTKIIVLSGGQVTIEDLVYLKELYHEYYKSTHKARTAKL